MIFYLTTITSKTLDLVSAQLFFEQLVEFMKMLDKKDKEES